MLTMWDAAYPPSSDPGFPIAAGYIGGADAAHVWTPAQWEHVRSFPAVQYLLPIYVASNVSLRGGGLGAGNDCILWGREHDLPTGVAVALDVEANVAQAAHDSGYVAAWADRVRAAGWVPLVYTSASYGHLFAPLELWLAEWNGTPHLIDGTAATQYSGGAIIDLSVVRDGFALWPAHPDPHGGTMPNVPIVDIRAHPTGYAQLGADGGVFVYGDPDNKYFHGSAHGKTSAPATALAYTPDYGGYYITTSDGGVFAFGNAKYLGHAYDGK